MAELLKPTPGLTDAQWQKVNRLGGGKPTYENQRPAFNGLVPTFTVTIVHPSGDRIPTFDPLSYPMRPVLVSIDPPEIVTVRECDVLAFHGAPCAARSVDAKAMRRG